MFGLLAVLVVLAMTPSSFAQVSVTLTPNASASETQTNRAINTADPGAAGAGILVTGQLIANSPLTTTTLRIVYPSPITSSPGAVGASGIPINDPIRIEGATGVFALVSNPTVSTTFSRVSITLPGFPASVGGNSASGSFRLVGVRIDANGKTAPVNVTASLSDNNANYVLQTTSATVVNAFGAGLASIAIGARSGQPNLGTATIFTNRTVPDGKASMIITEGHASAFRSTTQLSNSGVSLDNGGAAYNSTRIRLTFGNVPTGVTLTLSLDVPASVITPLNAKFTASGGIGATITSTVNTATIEITNSSLTTVESLNVNLDSIAVSSTAAVTAAGTITVTATHVPICDTTLNDLSLPIITNGYPCFAQADVGPLSVVNIVPTNSTLLMPYAAVLPPFDTGLAVANTTADPFGSGGGGATPSSGTIRLDFFPTATTGGAGTPFSLTTSSTVRPGSGLSSDGSLASGATWTVLLSQVLTAAGQTGNFVGYVFIQANFLNAHGTATISDFRTYSLSANVLVLPPPSTSPRNSPPNGAESLTF
jgi:hypothetical protein